MLNNVSPDRYDYLINKIRNEYNRRLVRALVIEYAHNTSYPIIISFINIANRVDNDLNKIFDEITLQEIVKWIRTSSDSEESKLEYCSYLTWIYPMIRRQEKVSTSGIIDPGFEDIPVDLSWNENNKLVRETKSSIREQVEHIISGMNGALSHGRDRLTALINSKEITETPPKWVNFILTNTHKTKIRRVTKNTLFLGVIRMLTNSEEDLVWLKALDDATHKWAYERLYFAQGNDKLSSKFTDSPLLLNIEGIQINLSAHKISEQYSIIFAEMGKGFFGDYYSLMRKAFEHVLGVQIKDVHKNELYGGPDLKGEKIGIEIKSGMTGPSVAQAAWMIEWINRGPDYKYITVYLRRKIERL